MNHPVIFFIKNFTFEKKFEKIILKKFNLKNLLKKILQKNISKYFFTKRIFKNYNFFFFFYYKKTFFKRCSTSSGVTVSRDRVNT